MQRVFGNGQEVRAGKLFFILALILAQLGQAAIDLVINSYRNAQPALFLRPEFLLPHSKCTVMGHKLLRRTETAQESSRTNLNEGHCCAKNRPSG